MRLFSLLALLPLLQVASATFGQGHHPHPPYCGTTVVTKTHTGISITKAPAVTKTITKDKQLCFTTETKTVGATVTSKVKVTSTVTNQPTEYKTKWAPAITVTKTHTKVKPTCGDSGVQIKRSINDEVAGEYISNAERIRRGLPLNKPEKRHNHPGQPGHPGPSCVPSTSVSWVGATEIKTVTPTQWATTTKCRYTHTVDKVKTTTATVPKTKTLTETVRGEPTTIKTTLTPTATAWTTTTTYKITGTCRPTNY